MSKSVRLLVVEDNADDALLIARELRRSGFDSSMERVETAAQMSAALESGNWDAIICDHRLPEFSAPAALQILRQHGKDIPFIIVSGAISDELAVSAMRAGARDYVSKNNLARLAPAIERELEEARLRQSQRIADDALRTAERLASVGRMAASISHEINNPLAAVTNLIYLARCVPGLAEAAKQYLLVAEQELSRVANITRKTLGFYRDTSPPGWVEAGKLMDEVLFIYGGQVAARDLSLDRRYAEKAMQVFTNVGELRQVLSNLVGNAIDASAQGGSLRIRISPGSCQGEPGVRFLIADQGEGISAANMTRVFEPFFSTKKDIGTGLGLWVSLGIVKKHGGSIRFRSRAEKNRSGTIFTVFWPQSGAIPAVPAYLEAAAGPTAAMAANPPHLPI